MSKVAALLSAYHREGLSDDVHVLAQQFEEQLNARTSRIESGSWADKLVRLVTAVLNEDQAAVDDLAEEYEEVPALWQAVHNRRWEGWRRAGYGDN